jgi:hypothetical protein
MMMVNVTGFLSPLSSNTYNVLALHPCAQIEGQYICACDLLSPSSHWQVLLQGERKQWLIGMLWEQSR